MSDKPVLYHWEPNTFSLKPLIALKEKGIEFDSRYVDFSAFEYAKVPAPNAEIESAHNPEGEGPVLVHKGTAMTESLFITLYLDEAFSDKPLRPADAHGRWQILMWARFVGEVLSPAVSTLGCHKYLVPALAKRNRADVERAIEKLPALESRNAWTAALNNSYSDDLIEDSRRKLGIAVKKAEDALQKSDWLVGNAFSLSDIDMFALLHPAQKLAPDAFSGAAKMTAWLERVRSRPGVKAVFAMAKTAHPDECFTPGPEHSRWG